nr:unnamed protein product [Digitaria exilis]
MVKVMNFNWHKFEVQLVSSLLRKAISLDKLLLVSPDVTLQDMPGVQEADLSLLKEALTNGQMILSESDDPATDQPFHSEVKKRSLVMPPKLRTITVADCWGFANLNLVPVPSLRSFCYRGDFVDAPFFLPSDAALSDLYIRFADSVAELYNTRKLRKSLPKDLSGLNVLTICWNALEVFFALLNVSHNLQAAPCLMPNTNLHNLRELQLIMSEMKAANLDDLYVFFTTFQCPNLERLFVQLPASSDKPMEGGSFDEVWEEPPEDDLDNPMEGGSFDEVWEEPPEDDLDNLLMVKVMNFNWRCSEVQLVSFLLRKASSLRKLLIVSPNVTPPPDLPCVESDFLLIKEALTNGKIILSESDDAGIQPYHSKVFIMV